MFENHKKIEKNVFILLILAVLVTAVGGIVEIFPLFIKEVSIERVSGMRPHTPLELAGFNIYKREGCYGCHSQQVRPLRDEFERYGHYSLAAESMYDYPFQWGSKRTGPDIARVGEKYSDEWQKAHLINPRSLVPVSIMPGYPHLMRKLDYKDLGREMELLRFVGVPYSDRDLNSWEQDLFVQVGLEVDSEAVEAFATSYNNPAMRKFDGSVGGEITEMDALIAYLQSLGNRVDFSTNQGRNW